MQENEVIIVNKIPQDIYHKIAIEAVKYAIISQPFTIDRMRLRNRNLQIFNIAKGKIAEGLFNFFCEANDIAADFANCETPYYKIDNRDFLLLGAEWDQKNNFLYHRAELLTSHQYVDLPALVPNRPGREDQWQKRITHYFKNTVSVKFLFTFMKAGEAKKRGGQFLSINLSEQQMAFLDDLHKKYRGLPQKKEPFTQDDFWSEMRKLKDDKKSLILNFRPHLIITGYADERHWNLFFDTEKEIFADGVLSTRIKNKTCYLHQLPSFLSLFPHLKNEMKFATIKNS